MVQLLKKVENIKRKINKGRPQYNNIVIIVIIVIIIDASAVVSCILPISAKQTQCMCRPVTR